jgi:DNA polymerase-3 subunit epsilon
MEPFEGDFIGRARTSAAQWAKDLLSTDPNWWVILDTETTGLSDSDQIVQVAVIDGAGNVLLNTLVKPTIQISESASRIHGITDETVKDARSFMVVWDEISDLIYGKLLIIYNAGFDLRLMQQSAMACGATMLEFPCDWNDAMDQYSQWCGEWSDYRGNFRWQRLPSGDHSALGDCQAVLALIKRMAGE